MSERPAAEVAAAYAELGRTARELGATLPDPFLALSFLGLSVVPELRLTDRGLLDVREERFVPLFC